MIVPLPVYATDESAAAASLLQLRADLNVEAASVSRQLSDLADHVSNALHAAQDIGQMYAIAREYDDTLNAHAELTAARVAAERLSPADGADRVRLANTLTNLRYRYSQLTVQIEALRGRAAFGSTEASSAPPSASSRDALRLLY